MISDRESQGDAASEPTLSNIKHRVIREHIETLIRSGRLRPGSQLPTDQQLARQFHVSRPTAARAMQDLVNNGIIERRAGAGSFVLGKALPQQRNVIGLLIPGLGETEIFDPICGKIAKSCPGCNYNLLWGDSPSEQAATQSEKSIALCQRYIDEKVLGVFWAPLELSEAMDDTNHRIAEMLRRAGTAVILLDRDYEQYPLRSPFDLIGIDNVRAGYTQAEHLLSHGVRRLVYFARRCSASTVTQRIIGFHAAKRAHGIHQEDWDVLLGDPQTPQTIQELLALNPEAVVCANDITAALLMRSLLDHGVEIPHDIRIIGIDDVRYSNLFSVSLTTVHQPCLEIGAEAVAAMVHSIDHRKTAARDVNLDCSLIIRESCGTRARKTER